MSTEPQDDVRQLWHNQRRFDMRLLKILGIPVTLAGLGMRFFPDPWNLWAFGVGFAVVVIGTLVEVCWIGPRQIRRIREIGKQEQAAFDQLLRERDEQPEDDKDQATR